MSQLEEMHGARANPMNTYPDFRVRKQGRLKTTPPLGGRQGSSTAPRRASRVLDRLLASAKYQLWGADAPLFPGGILFSLEASRVN